MDGSQFDRLTRTLSSRRTAVGGLLAGLLLPLDAAARKKGKHRKRKGRDKQRAQAQLEPCWRAGACIVSKGSNVSQCNLAGYTAPDGLDCTRCNLSRANLRGADLTGVSFTRANLSGACLVNADFTGATFANTTNLANAIFCRTIMPDGSTNNSGCGSGTPCCPTCDAAHLCPSGCCNAGICGACPAGSTCGGGNPGIPGICGCTGSGCGCPVGQKPCNDGCIPISGCCQDSECNDNNLCTTDACVNNVCVYTPIVCDDGLQCTADTCVNGVCVHRFERERCGPVSACEVVHCGYDRDCARELRDELCPPHPRASLCMAPRCTSAGCTFQDICGASHPDCQGCAACSCNPVLNRCVRTCPS